MVNYSLNVLIMVIILFAAVVPVVTFGFFSAEETRHNIENEELKLSREIVSEQKEKINLYFTERKADISLFLKLPFVKENIHYLFEDFNDVIISGGHDNVVSTVQSKKVMAGATSTITYDRMVNEGLIEPEEIVIIWESDIIQGLPFVLRSDLPEDLKEKIKNSFFKMHHHKLEDGYLGGWGNIIAYSPVTEDNYLYAFKAVEVVGDT